MISELETDGEISKIKNGVTITIILGFGLSSCMQYEYSLVGSCNQIMFLYFSILSKNYVKKLCQKILIDNIKRRGLGKYNSTKGK